MNKCVYLDLDRKRCDEITEKFFLRESGIDKQGPKFDKMKKDAHQIRKVVESNVSIRAAYAYYDDVKLQGKTLSIGGQELDCAAFEQIDPESIEGAFVYAICAGDFWLDDKPILEQLYADIWGTAFTDASRELLMEQMGKGMTLSDSFGPGFYGMSMNEMQKMLKLVDFEALGIVVKPSNVIVPLKSCSGIFLHVNDKYQRLDSACQLCFGASRTCRLCGINKKYGERIGLIT